MYNEIGDIVLILNVMRFVYPQEPGGIIPEVAENLGLSINLIFIPIEVFFQY
uniref:Uncharacterized protein n=1 Tax=uncultured Desulfobacterium sp. TaxID=201089 RepID=E1YFS6_9BACT|nr:unknown protein [uncultured Desulfobacterium sp.]